MKKRRFEFGYKPKPLSLVEHRQERAAAKLEEKADMILSGAYPKTAFRPIKQAQIYQSSKTEKSKQWLSMTPKYCCQTCFHHITDNCADYARTDNCCGYWYNPNSEIEGIAYGRKEPETTEPLLFAQKQ